MADPELSQKCWWSNFYGKWTGHTGHTLGLYMYSRAPKPGLMWTEGYSGLWNVRVIGIGVQIRKVLVFIYYFYIKHLFIAKNKKIQLKIILATRQQKNLWWVSPCAPVDAIALSVNDNPFRDLPLWQGSRVIQTSGFSESKFPGLCCIYILSRIGMVQSLGPYTSIQADSNVVRHEELNQTSPITQIQKYLREINISPYTVYRGRKYIQLNTQAYYKGQLKMNKISELFKESFYLSKLRIFHNLVHEKISVRLVSVQH